MSKDPKPPGSAGKTGGDAPLLDIVARRIEELSAAVVEQTERLIEQPTEPEGADLAAILAAARRSSELARELIELARRERDSAAAALLNVAQGPTLPSERPRDTEPVRSHRRVKNEADEGRQRVVLLVEDEALLLKTMCRMLEQCGHRVLSASNPIDGLAIADRETVIDLVVTDLALPGMPGGELVKRLRTSRPRLRVLYTSGWDPASSGVEVSDDGTEAFLSKPFTAVELDARLSELLGTPPLRLAERS
jgi:CheY-like chemotaxis protein